MSVVLGSLMVEELLQLGFERKEFLRQYGLQARYWRLPEVLGRLGFLGLGMELMQLESAGLEYL